nr:nucleoside deaminase [Corynebacterium sp. HMSC04H06]
MPAPTHGLPDSEGSRRAESRMRRALEVAAGTPAGDVPVGAVLFDASGRELTTGVNRREQRQDPTAHAEVEAIRAAVKEHGDGWRLTGCELVVTLEPCAMCAGALLGARVSSVVFGAFEPKTGACGSWIDLVRAPGGLHIPQVRAGVLDEECAQLMARFFEPLR